MKVVLFCGGLGLRMRESEGSLPKPMMPIGHRPVLWHVMRYYAHFGHNEFILCLGHGAKSVKEYFLNYEETASNDFVLSKGGEQIELLDTDISDWRITFVDTGIETPIGERLRRVRHHLDDDQMFLANYGDVLTDAPLDDMVKQVRDSNDVASMLAIKPRESFHVVTLTGDSRVGWFRPGRRHGHSDKWWVLRAALGDLRLPSRGRGPRGERLRRRGRRGKGPGLRLRWLLGANGYPQGTFRFGADVPQQQRAHGCFGGIGPTQMGQLRR